MERDLSRDASNYLQDMRSGIKEYVRQDWDTTFLNISKEIAKRSPDAETQVGSVIVDNNNHIVGAGYNGWMPGIDDGVIPNTRPLKHDWAIHSELNAILNCTARPVGCTIYCTHKPCMDCFSAIVASGIKEVVYISGNTTTNDRKTQIEVAEFLTSEIIKVRKV